MAKYPGSILAQNKAKSSSRIKTVKYFTPTGLLIQTRKVDMFRREDSELQKFVKALFSKQSVVGYLKASKTSSKRRKITSKARKHG